MERAKQSRRKFYSVVACLCNLWLVYLDQSLSLEWLHWSVCTVHHIGYHVQLMPNDAIWGCSIFSTTLPDSNSPVAGRAGWWVWALGIRCRNCRRSDWPFSCCAFAKFCKLVKRISANGSDMKGELQSWGRCIINIRSDIHMKLSLILYDIILLYILSYFTVNDFILCMLFSWNLFYIRWKQMSPRILKME